MGKWMGQPYDIKYQKTSNKYLNYEAEAAKEIIQYLESSTKEKNIVIDTTGSVIYTGDEIMSKLKELTKIIYLDTPKSVKQEMCRLFFQNPRPVIWGKSFKKCNGESSTEALKRCYPKLLNFRTKRYQKYAHVILNYYLLRSNNFKIDNFLNILQNKVENIT